MLKIILIFIIFNLQSLTNADDITDFEIEGISIGDSLLSFASKNQINSIKSSQQYKSKYTIYDIEKIINTKTYDYMSLTTKNNDKDFIVTSVAGIINYIRLDDCLNQQKQISKEIESILNYDDKDERVYPSQRQNRKF